MVVSFFNNLKLNSGVKQVGIFITALMHTCPEGEGRFSCIQLNAEANDSSRNQEGPDHQLQQVTEPRPSSRAWKEE